MKTRSALFIIGGMGPEAAVYLYKLLIDLAIKKFGAKNNDDFPEVILHSIPVPDFISNNSNRDIALAMLKQAVKQANNLDISCFSIACNTAHVLLPELRKVSKVPFISMIAETAKQVHKDKKKRVGLLGTPSTIRYGLYQTALNACGISTVVPTKKQIAILEKIIRNVLKGEILASDSRDLKEIADGLIKSGAEALILGCTELPLVFPKKFSLPVYNCVEILAMALLQKYYAMGIV